jgi:CTP:molybdopterin cytidylyltransferase MocA
MSRPVVGAVLLAAGQGERIGRRPKALLALGGQSLIERQLRALADAGVQQTVVVLGHHADQLMPVARHFPVSLVHNPRPDDGPVSSQRLGLSALAGTLDAVIVALADQPLVGAADLRDLIDAWARRPAGTGVVYPEVGGQRGNPVIMRDDVRTQILASADDFGCRQWQAAHPDQVWPFVSDNRHYRLDIDTEDDRLRFEAETGLRLAWPAEPPHDRGPD